MAIDTGKPNQTLQIMESDREFNLMLSIAAKVNTKLETELDPLKISSALSFEGFSMEELMRIQGYLNVAISQEAQRLIANQK